MTQLLYQRPELCGWRLWIFVKMCQNHPVHERDGARAHIFFGGGTSFVVYAVCGSGSESSLSSHQTTHLTHACHRHCQPATSSGHKEIPHDEAFALQPRPYG